VRRWDEQRDALRPAASRGAGDAGGARGGWAGLRVLSVAVILGGWGGTAGTQPPAVHVIRRRSPRPASSSPGAARWGSAGDKSLSVLAWGLLLSIVVGVALACDRPGSRIVEALLEVRWTPSTRRRLVALVPVIVLWVGFGPPARVVVVFLFSVFAIRSNTAKGGAAGSDPELMEVARSYLAREVGLWRDVRCCRPRCPTLVRASASRSAAPWSA